LQQGMIICSNMLQETGYVMWVYWQDFEG